ncbi:arabinogalactan protein 41-like [Magnolia sinica]|uniref:arabinogalactan protein 41-like n=1 Tax=Magnolia sinica TaxID=86752 RepID=UPI0026586CF4|nr:arabinogalactan protein 41-like [Magnolia sinica]
MELMRVSFTVMTILALVVAINAQSSSSPAPAPASDGVAIDQGIAYVLMLAALVLTYLIH